MKSSNTKKSLSVNKVNTNINKPIKFENVTISNNFHNVKLVSLSQGKNNNKQSNNNILNNSPTQNITQNSFNIQKINIIGNNYNPNKKSKNNNYLYSNDFMAFTNTNIDGYKTFFNINKSKDKYNFKINTGYIKEEGKKYKNIMNNTLNETKILYSQCWLYEILNLAIRKYPASNIDNREIKNGIENVFNNITNKLMDAVFSKKTDSKYINNELFVLPFLPHVYTNISKELYKDDDLYHKNAEGSKNIHSNFNRKAFISKISLDNIEKKKSYFDEVNTSQNGLNARSKTFLPEKGPKSEAEEVQNSINAFYKSYVKVAQYSSEYCTTKNIPPDIKTKLENQQNIYINDYYQGLAFITLEENFYSLIKSIFGDNLTNAKKFYTEIINKLLSKIKSTQNKKEFFTEYSHHFLVNLIKNSSKNISIVGKEPFMEYIKSPMFFTGSPNVLHGWKIIIELLSENYSEILHDLLVDIEDKNMNRQKKN